MQAFLSCVEDAFRRACASVVWICLPNFGEARFRGEVAWEGIKRFYREIVLFWVSIDESEMQELLDNI